METKKIEINLSVLHESELTPQFRQLVQEAKDASQKAYAPYSHFQVGAAILLSDGKIVIGNNQENAAYPSGLCAERVAMFQANALYPHTAPTALAIAAYTNGNFLTSPITPCGSCRQVLLETEKRYDKPITVLLYGTEKIYLLKTTKELLPLSFDEKSLKNT